MPIGVPRCPDHHDHAAAKVADRDGARFAAIEAIVVDVESLASEDDRRVGEVQAQLPKGPVSLLRVERDNHLFMDIHK